jgi:hypothetical protein
MEMQPERGDKVEVTPVLGTTEIQVGDETFLANRYVSHTITSGQLEYVGKWKMKATAKLSSTEVKATKYIFFRNDE